MIGKEAILAYLGGMEKAELERLLLKACSKYRITHEELSGLLKIKKTNVRIPSTVFFKELGCLESVVKYLREELNYGFHQIAVLLNRDNRTIWTTYQKAKLKHPKMFSREPRIFSIPLSILDDRRLGALESIVAYLRDEMGYRFSDIGKYLKRDERTIWTTYHRAKVKVNER